ncbi:MAG: ATP-binding protein [Raoultibacter sp.]
MLERKAYKELLNWKNTQQGQSALLIEGARRVGKSLLAEEFGKREYRSYLLIDFSKAAEDVKNLFRTKREDLDSFFSFLSVYYNTAFYERETLLIFDEVQLFPEARSFIKHLVADGRYDYLETGSLISIKRNVQDILIPSEEETLELNPFDFDEFLWAIDERALANLLRETAASLTPLPVLLHRKAMELFRTYILVGGMPQAVTTYAESLDFLRVDAVKQRILTLYRNDIKKYAGEDQARVGAILDDIPAQLSTHEKKFKLASLEKGARSRTYENAFFWLEDARITNTCFNATDPHVGLSLYKESPRFKCYLADTGLLSSLVFSDKKTQSAQLYKDILFGKLEINEGMLMENMVAQMLKASGHSLYFYSRYSKEAAADRMEVDFLITQEFPKTKVCPIEVKSTKRYATSSLDKFKAKFTSRVGTQYVLHTQNIKKEAGRNYLPLYLTPYF